MGQFLAIGLVTEITVSKDKVDSAQIDMKQLQERMRKKMLYVPELYTANLVEDSHYRFVLKEDIFYSELIPFLSEFYPLLYDEPAYYKDVVSKLTSMPPSEWLGWAKVGPEEAFQFDKYGAKDYIHEGIIRIPLNYDCLLLSMEGKIAMEVFGRQFRFFKYTMMQAFQQFNLSGALRVYITG